MSTRLLRREATGPMSRLASGTPLLELSGVCAELDGRAVLRGVDLSVSAGELVALVGPNGAGKSTVLAVAAGDLAFSEGAVVLMGAAVAELSALEMARCRAVLPQHSEVAFPFTVAEVVAMGCARWSEVDGPAIVEEAMASVEVGHLAHRRVPHLSGGERARVALARVLAQGTQLLMLDEPTAALDVHHQQIVLEVVRRRVSAGAGALAVLHDLPLAAAHADRLVLLSEGQVAAEGAPADVLRAELLSEVYRHPIEVVPHPSTGAPLVLPLRSPTSGGSS